MAHQSIYRGIQLALLLAFILPATGANAIELKTATSKPKTTAPKVVDKNIAKRALTGAGKREVNGANLSLASASGSSPSYQPNYHKLNTSSNDSVLVINGRIHVGDQKYVSATPLFATPHLVFPDAPKNCVIKNSFWPQTKKDNYQYKYYYIFKDTGGKAPCWAYFNSLKSITTKIQKARLAVNSAWDKHDFPIENPGAKRFRLSKLQAKGSGGD